MPPAPFSDWLERFLAGRKLEVGEALSVVERGGDPAKKLLARIHAHTGRAQVVGVTGPPGAGKSTLVNALALHLAGAGRRVAVLAIDPSSPFTGGALLGDRVRMSRASGDERIFIRSTATRGSLGGLARTTHELTRVFDAAGYDPILVETVGIGQSEVDVWKVAHTPVVVEAPGLGDAIQSMKAGVLEIASILCVNKADLPGTDAKRLALEEIARYANERTPGWKMPVVATVASSGQGVPELAEHIAAHAAYLATKGRRVAIETNGRYHTMTEPKHVDVSDLRRIAVVGGGGLMGHGIVLACLAKDQIEVRLVSRRAESLEHGMELLRSGPFGLEGLVKKGKIGEDEMHKRLARVHGTLDIAAGVRDADLVFETIPEVVPAKHAVLREIEAAAPSSATIATNTSSIMIGELAGALERPERLIGTHWFYPSNVMPLVEVARGDRTAKSVVDATVGFLRTLRKKPVVVRDGPGFFMTRFINIFIAEAMLAVESGVCTIEDVDEMVKTGLGWPMGVFELLDKTASFDSWYHAQEYLHEALGERYAIPPMARRVFQSGYRGAPDLKPGSRGGFYDYFGARRGEGK